MAKLEPNDTIRAAITGNPLRFLSSLWPWRALAYQATSAVLAVLLIPLVIVGLLALPAIGIGLGRIERYRLRLLRVGPLSSAHVKITWRDRGHWFRTRTSEPATWREAGYTIVTIGFGMMALAVYIVLCAVVFVAAAMPQLISHMPQEISFLAGPTWVIAHQSDLPPAYGVAAILVLLAVYLHSALAALHCYVAVQLLSPRDEELETRVRRLVSSRSVLLNSFDAERKSIERSLHDGVQQKIVSASLSVGLAVLDIDQLPLPGDRLTGIRARLEAAQQSSEAALAELRDIVRGMHPQVLTDRGLTDAVTEIADRNPTPVYITEGPRVGRLPPDVELLTYHFVNECLTNATKHAKATKVWIDLAFSGETLVSTVSDDGRGGAAPAGNSGLGGLRERAEALQGDLAIHSPPGGPTRVRLSIPCQ